MFLMSRVGSGSGATVAAVTTTIVGTSVKFTAMGGSNTVSVGGSHNASDLKNISIDSYFRSWVQPVEIGTPHQEGPIGSQLVSRRLPT
jgi:hypothetical protein